MDRETVITHLQIIHTWAEFARERDLQFFTPKHLEDIAEWSADALELLKEQNGLMLALEQSNAANEYLNAEVERLTGLLKEQEVVESKTGHWNGSECSNCHAIFVRSVFDKPEYCSHCGAKMEGR